jgi:hypothetical protein
MSMAQKMTCRRCGGEMNHHADKLLEPRTAEDVRHVDAALGGIVEETHGCPGCGNVQACRLPTRPDGPPAGGR